MKMKKEKSELESISDLIQYCWYEIRTTDGIVLKCSLHKSRRTAFADPCSWTWEVSWQIAESVWWLAWQEKGLYSVPEYHTLESCIRMMNDYIKRNFKTELD